ncbi:hypothetical protein ACHAAC_04325 [Aeromicrobium sp. CF4.19]|uniref:hypothetical protein n=1 Tax=Aeromicrobium sp. CF4.19 TaxID=3373082 RepID=UPI003EE74F54
MTTSTDAVLSVTGSATIRDHAEPPAAGVLTVKLVTKDGEVLAAVAVAATEADTPFELTVDATLAPTPGGLRLWAMLRTDAGVWGTPELVTLREELVLSRVDG